MKFYTQQHVHYCGIDLHARTMYLCILNQAGAIVLHRNMKSDPDSFLKAIAPFRENIVVAVECIFTWYWLADLCAREKIAFVLGHALYMKAIHGGKAKNDKIDAYKIAVLLRGGMIPEAYVYPEGMRSTRDLLRRRMQLMRQRAELLTHIQNTKPPVQPSCDRKEDRLPKQPRRSGRTLCRSQRPIQRRLRSEADRLLRRSTQPDRTGNPAPCQAA